MLYCVSNRSFNSVHVFHQHKPVLAPIYESVRTVTALQSLQTQQQRQAVGAGKFDRLHAATQERLLWLAAQIK